METAFVVTLIITAAMYSLSAAILLYAFKMSSHGYHLVGIAIWCIHVVIFTLVTLLRNAGYLDISVHVLNLWSSAIRIHGGIVGLITAAHYALLKEPKH